MPDQNDQSQSSPQSLVDAALSTTTETTTVSTSAPVVAPISPMTPPPLSPLAPPSTSTTTTVTQAGAAPTVAMGDDTPLAFASMPGSTTTTTTSQTTPVSSMESSYIPPVPGVGQAPTGIAPAPEKKKSKMGKILAVFFGFLMLGGAAFGGYTYYINNFGVTADIAVVTSSGQADCESRCDGGHKLAWRNGQCVWRAALCDTGATPAPTGGVKTCTGGTCTCSGNYTYCGGAIDKCVPTAEIAAAGGGCNKYGEVVYGIPTVYGANYSKPVDGKCAIKKCNCGGFDICFDKTGYCDQKDTNATGGIVGTDYNKQGLCALAGSYSSPTDPNATFIPKDPTLTSKYTCTDSKCSTTDASCVVVHYTCKETKPNVSCIENGTAPSKNASFTSKCGTVEQIDVSCGTPLTYVTSRTKINPPCDTTTTTTTTTAPTMSCTGLTSVPALTPTAPVIGNKLTFTCAGVVTPATAGTLSYKFRYSIDSGTYKTLANKTATTAELTIAACGAYSVECQACATLAGVVTCNPVWTGATQ